jgi:hypothetical protein
MNKHHMLIKNAKINVIAEKMRAIPKNFFELILPDGIGRSGCATLSMLTSVISFHISAAKKPEYRVNIDKRMILKISIE